MMFEAYDIVSLKNVKGIFALLRASYIIPLNPTSGVTF